MRRAFILGIGLAASAAAQSSLLPPDVLFLSRTLRHIRESVTAVPNYTCTETLSREELTPPAKKFRQLDLVRLEVARIGTKEVFGWPGAGKFEDKPISELLGEGGLVAEGLFGSFSADLFVHRAASL